MATRLILFLLVSYQLWMTVSSAQVGLEEADSFVSAFGSFLKPRGSIVLEVPCKSVNRSVFVLVETGGEGGERLVVGRIEEGTVVCSSADSPQTVLEIGQTPPASAAPVGGHDNGRKRDGSGGGGRDPGGGSDDPGGDDPRRGGRSDGDEENLGLDEERRQRDYLNNLAQISIVITAQTAASLISFPKEKASTSQKCVLNLAVGMVICAYIFCLTAILFQRNNPSMASIMAVFGICSSGFGFILMMSLIVPANLMWVVVVASIVLLSFVFILFISYK